MQFSHFIQQSSIKVKLIFIIMATSTIAIFMALGIFLTYDYYSYQKSLIDDLQKRASLLGKNGQIAVSFRYSKILTLDLYSALTSEDNIHHGIFFDANGEVLACFDRDNLQDIPESLLDEHIDRIVNDTILHCNTHQVTFYNEQVFFNILDNNLSVYLPILEDNKSIGVVYLSADLTKFKERYYSYFWVLICILIATLIVVYLISIWFQKLISQPILSLTSTMKNVSETQNYSIRLDSVGKDEIGTLVDGFNKMISQIDRQNHDLVLAKETAERAKELAENSVKVKEQFLANMSHEIRTPMNGIVGFTSVMLDDDTIDEHVKNNLRIIKQSADYLLVLINDILDLTKIETGKLVFDETEIDLSNILDSIITWCKEQTDRKKLRITVDLPPDMPAIFIGDPVRFNQILLNLYSNAVKFTEKGSVTIGGRKIDEDEKTLLLEFFVEDTGIGIPKDKFEYIFQIFTQASGDTTRKFGGSGLGLSISKQLVELQGGHIKLESELGKGSRFSFQIRFKKYIPKKIEAIPQIKTPISTSTNGQSNKKLSHLHILVAEDNEVNAMLITTILQRWKAQVTNVLNGKEVLQVLEKQHFDILLLDVHMPEMDGYEVTKIIRSLDNSLHSQLPIIAMTASAHNGERERCLSAGMNDYIAKPFNMDELYQTICMLTDKKLSL